VAEDAQVLAGIVVDGEREEQAAVQVLLDAGDGRDLPGERDVEHVRARLRPEPDPIALSQVLGDGTDAVHLFERECSLQRRRQKVVEEALSPGINAAVRARMTQAAAELSRAVGYRSAGTVEFLVDDTTGEFFFIEMNTRIQVEHPVTEMICGVDLVAEQLRIAGGEPLAVRQDDIAARGAAIEFRKHLGWYVKGVPGSADLRRKLHAVVSLAQVEDVFASYLADPVGDDADATCDKEPELADAQAAA